jgi:hypothetical protein
MNDKLEIIEVINRYLAALDKHTFDVETFKKIFVNNAKVVRPNGQELTGPQEISSSHAKSMDRFRATQHLTSGFIINSVDEANSDFRVNIIALHFWKEGFGDQKLKKDDNYFLAGGVFTGTVTKTDDDWQISTIRNDVLWRQGVGFKEMLNTK